MTPWIAIAFAGALAARAPSREPCEVRSPAFWWTNLVVAPGGDATFLVDVSSLAVTARLPDRPGDKIRLRFSAPLEFEAFARDFRLFAKRELSAADGMVKVQPAALLAKLHAAGKGVVGHAVLLTSPDQTDG